MGCDFFAAAGDCFALAGSSGFCESVRVQVGHGQWLYHVSLFSCRRHSIKLVQFIWLNTSILLQWTKQSNSKRFNLSSFPVEASYGFHSLPRYRIINACRSWGATKWFGNGILLVVQSCLWPLVSYHAMVLKLLIDAESRAIRRIFLRTSLPFLGFLS
jgi:hypothetical protein